MAGARHLGRVVQYMAHRFIGAIVFVTFLAEGLPITHKVQDAPPFLQDFALLTSRQPHWPEPDSGPGRDRNILSPAFQRWALMRPVRTESRQGRHVNGAATGVVSSLTGLCASSAIQAPALKRWAGNVEVPTGTSPGSKALDLVGNAKPLGKGKRMASGILNCDSRILSNAKPSAGNVSGHN